MVSQFSYVVPEEHELFFRELHELCKRHSVGITGKFFGPVYATFDRKSPFSNYEIEQVAGKECGYKVSYRPAFFYLNHPPEGRVDE